MNRETAISGPNVITIDMTLLAKWGGTVLTALFAVAGATGLLEIVIPYFIAN